MRGERPFWFRAASRIFRWCGRLTPKAFRERFGWESEEAFQHLVEDTLAREGSGAAMTTAAAACSDIARTGMVERASGWRGALGSGLTGDAAQAARIYRREPLFAGAIALILALVAGPAVAIFAVLYGMVLAPLPYPDADRLVVIVHTTSSGTNPYLRAASVADYRTVTAFSSVGGIFPISLTIATDGPPERVQGFRTTGALLTDMGVPFAAGRDLRRGEANVVVITRGFAVTRFGSELAAIDKPLVVSTRTMRIVGVAAYRPILPGSFGGGDLFIPHENADRAVPPRHMSQAIVIARVKPEVTRAEALGQTRAAALAVQKQFGEPPAVPDLVQLRTATSGALRVPMLILFAAVAVVFLIGVSSLASLVLARAAARAADVAVRTSLGASRWRLVRAWLVDGAMLAVPGVALGAWIGHALLGYTRAQVPPGLVILPEGNPVPSMIAAALVLGGASVVLFGLAPISAGLLRASSLRFLRVTHHVADLRRVRLQSGLIAGQVAISLVLVASAIWLSSSLWRVFARPVGFDVSNLVVIQVRSAQPQAAQLEVARRLSARLKQMDPGLGAGVALSSSLPGVNASIYVPFRIRPDQPMASEADRPRVAHTAVSVEYFHVLGIPLLEGRLFADVDDAAPDRVIVLSRSFAAKWFPDGALGKSVAFGANDRREIIGIVEDVHAGRLTEESTPQFYTPSSGLFLGSPSNCITRTSRPIDAVRTDVTAMLRQLDPTAQLTVLPADEAMALPLLMQTIANRLVIALALVALLLATVNVYALSAFAVVQRTREIGIRVALGANASAAMHLVMRRGLGWVGAGLVIGTVATIFVAAPLVQGQLYETTARDPRLLALAFAVVAAVAVLASWLPARRAAAIDPAETLRAE
jgi:predicted permease